MTLFWNVFFLDDDKEANFFKMVPGSTTEMELCYVPRFSFLPFFFKWHLLDVSISLLR